MESKKKITDAAIKRWLHKNGQKITAYKFDFMRIETRRWRAVPAPKIPEVQDQLPVGLGIDPQKAMRDLAEQLERKFKEQVLLILTQGGKKQ